MNGHERIIIDPAICHDKPLIRGTRMPVAPRSQKPIRAN